MTASATLKGDQLKRVHSPTTSVTFATLCDAVFIELVLLALSFLDFSLNKLAPSSRQPNHFGDSFGKYFGDFKAAEFCLAAVLRACAVQERATTVHVTMWLLSNAAALRAVRT